MTMTPDAAAEAPRTVSPAQAFYWSVRRELWENRSIVLAPLIVAALVFFGFMLSLFTLQIKIPGGPSQPDVAIQRLTTALVFLTGLLVATFYSLGALYGERRDRSILFWKSLPVSDVTTVLSKAAIPLVVMPLVVFVVAMATKAVVVVFSLAALSARGEDPAMLWATLDLPRDIIMLVYSLITQTLWHAPIWAWLLLVSAWAKRAPFLWAIGLPLAPCIVEKIGFRASYFTDLLSHRLTGWPVEAFDRGRIPRSPDLSDFTGFLSSTGVWSGLAVAAAFLAAAVWLRRRREPI